MQIYRMVLADFRKLLDNLMRQDRRQKQLQQHGAFPVSPSTLARIGVSGCVLAWDQAAMITRGGLNSNKI